MVVDPRWRLRDAPLGLRLSPFRHSHGVTGFVSFQSPRLAAFAYGPPASRVSASYGGTIFLGHEAQCRLDANVTGSGGRVLYAGEQR
jgi:hypothetical protein